MLNKVILIGRITKDIELRNSTNGKIYAFFNLAVNRMKKDEVDFINCIVWEKQAETMANFLSKGSLIAIDGYINVSKNKEGLNQTIIVAKKVDFINIKKNINEIDKEEPKEKKKKEKTEAKDDEVVWN